MDGDPFGRDDSDAAAAASATSTAPATAASDEPAPVARPSQAERQARRERADQLLLLVFVVGVFAALGAVLASQEHRASASPAVKAAKAADNELKGKRLFDSAALRAALDLAHQRNPGTTVTSLDVRPDRLDLEIRDTPGKEFTVDVRASQGVSTSDFGTTTDRGVAWGLIDTAAPGRVIAALTNRFHADASQLDYLVFGFSDDPRTIDVFVKTAGPSDHYSADIHGRHLTKGS